MMRWRIVIDYKNRREYYPVSSEWSANLICSNWRENARARGDNITKFRVECVNEKGEHVDCLTTD